MLEAAGRLVDRFADGAWLAELAPLGDPAQVASEVARALGAPELPGQPALDTVQAFLAEKELLLLLDNAEHLVDAVAGIAGRLLAAAPRLRILTTSREALAVPGEAVLQLQSLSCPGGRGPGRRPRSAEPPDLDAAGRTEAVRLFLDRATSVDPAFTLGEANVASISEICRRLDGIPLAIELAAARVSVLSPDDIAQRLGDRFRLLAGGRRTAVPRQQTLHALIDWSWDLLTDDDRRLLRRLSIFAGGWTVPGGRARRRRRRRRRRRGRAARPPDPARRSQPRDRGSRPEHPLPDARDDPPVRPREAHRGGRGRGAGRPPLRRVRRPRRGRRAGAPRARA